jgi:MFS family permease
VVTSGPAPGLTARFGRSVVAAGGVALTLGLVALALAVEQIGTTGSLVALVPGLLLVGAGIGLCFTPLTSMVLKHVDPARAGSASGAMSTTQQVGYSLGVAITGIVYFGASDQGIAHAFQLSLLQLAAVAAGIAVVSRLLPRISGAKSGINLTPSQQIADTVA